MAKHVQKEKALELRKNGESIKRIATKLDVSKSTVSYWCRDIILSEEQIGNLQERMRTEGAKALYANAQKKRKERIVQREKDFNNGSKLINSISKRDLLLLGIGLYWGEGYKSKKSNEFGFTNSDSHMILLYVKWLKEIFDVKKEELILRLSINDIHRNREKEVVEFWCSLLGVTKNQFTKTSFIKTSLKKKYKNHKDYYGVLRVKVRKGGRLKNTVLGALEKIKQETEEK